MTDGDDLDEPAVTDAERQAWPRTVAEAVDRLMARLSAEDTAAIRAMDKGEMTATLHFTRGLYVGNAYGLWRGNDALLSAAVGQPAGGLLRIHPDEASGVILAALRRRVRETERDCRDAVGAPTP